MRAKIVTTTNVTYWGTVLGSNEGVYVLLGLCRRNPYNSALGKKTTKGGAPNTSIFQSSPGALPASHYG